MNPPGNRDRLRARLNRPAAIDPDAPAAPVLAPVPMPAPAEEPPAPAVEEPAAEPVEPEKAPARRASPRRATRRPGTPPAADLSWKGKTALEDPDCIPGRKYYRSFYVHDEVYFRFRAAIFWASRNPDAIGEVPQNMTAAVETFMEEVASDLEQRYNAGEVFRMPPPDKRRKGKSSP